MSNNVLVKQLSPYVTSLTLNRPERRNAFNDAIIKEMSQALEMLKNDTKLRMLILRGEGQHFCAGADLKWMKRMANASQEDNKADAAKLAALLDALNTFPTYTVAVTQGACYGGGVGLLSCCDHVIAQPNSTFCFSEVRLGLSPAVISPYVIKTIGERATRHYFLTAETFDEHQALKMGLVNEIGQEGRLDNLADHIELNSVEAMRTSKALILKQCQVDPNVKEDTIETIARERTSVDGIEGMNAFLEKRKPAWLND